MKSINVTHRPSGSMCQACTKGTQALGHVHCPKPDQFKNMRKIKTDKDGVIVVKCEGFKREK